MAPPIPQVPLSALQHEINTLPSGKPRRPPVNLADCALKEMVQYKCNSERPKQKGLRPIIVCEPVVRLFRE